MKIRALITGLTLLFPLAAAAASGSWSGDSAGGKVSVGNQTLTSRPLNTTLPPAATFSRISWRISLLSAPPPGLQIKLCSQEKCIRLDSLSGQKSVGSSLTARGPFYFVYTVESQGQLLPPLNVVKNQLTINYY